MRMMNRKGFLKTILATSSMPLGGASSALPSSEPKVNLPSPSGLKTFGTAGKEGLLYPDREVVLFERTGAGCMTHMWFGGDWPGYGRTRIRFYIDAETRPSIDMELFLGHGIGWNDPTAPWGTERVGKTGQPSGLYNTYRIPFGRSIRITGQLGAGIEKPQTFWWIFRGIENLPLRLASVELPPRARLRLTVRENATLEPFQFLDMCQSSRAGALYQVTLAAASRNFSYLEALLRAYVDDSNEPMMLSSGTEDYFLGTYYFNRDLYHLPVAGLTHKEEDIAGLCRFSAYRFHEQDPIFFQRGFRLVWRNGEKKDGKVYGDAPPLPTQATSYVWIYEW
jgi:hypothetical protein